MPYNLSHKILRRRRDWATRRNKLRWDMSRGDTYKVSSTWNPSPCLRSQYEIAAISGKAGRLASSRDEENRLKTQTGQRVTRRLSACRWSMLSSIGLMDTIYTLIAPRRHRMLA